MNKSKQEREMERFFRSLNRKKKQNLVCGFDDHRLRSPNNYLRSNGSGFALMLGLAFSGASSMYSPKQTKADTKFGKSSNKVVVKTNYCFAGHSKSKSGKRLTGSEVASKAQASLNYITRDGASMDLDVSSNLYSRDGSLMSVDDYSLFKEDLKEQELSGFRRVMISSKEDITRDEMRQVVVGALNEFARESNKEIDGGFAIHTNTEHIHAHILMISESFNNLRWSENDLELFKDIAAKHEQQLIDDRVLQTDRVIKNELNANKDKSHENERSDSYENARIH